MRQYETGFVVSPGLSEEETEKFISQMAEVVSLRKGKMIKVDIWGKRKMAYPVKRFTEGIYVFFHYEGEGDIPLELERRFKQTDTVIRFLTVKKDPKDMIRRKRKKPAGEPPAPVESGAEAKPEQQAQASDAVKEEEK